VTSPERTSFNAPEIVVYWRPGCGFCSSLFRQLDQQGVVYTKVDIWNDPDAAATVRAVNRGNETVPTVVVGTSSLVNPSAREVIALVEEHADESSSGR
jgi:glutaredoxin-like protein